MGHKMDKDDQTLAHNPANKGKNAKKALKKVSKNLKKASKMHGEQSKALANASKMHGKDAETTAKMSKNMKGGGNPHYKVGGSY